MLLEQDDAQHRQNIAVIGTGIAGMSAAWMISKHHQVTVFEKNRRIGGHSNTVDVPTRDGTIPVDTGFIVLNDRNYPNLVALFEHLGVDISDSDMSFAASINNGAIEYSGSDFNGLVGRRRNILSMRYWRMIKDILRFYREAPKLLAANPQAAMADTEQTLGDYLAANRYSDAFIQDHLLPMGAAIWSTKAVDMLAYPVSAFVAFFASHGLLTLNDRPQWKSVISGSRAYVKKLTAPFKDRIHSGAIQVNRHDDRVEVKDAEGNWHQFDQVVIASHADEALKLLDDADNVENDILGAFQYTPNRAVLHKDPALMPKRKRVWSSWNYLSETGGSEEDALCVTYWMNRLQRLETNEDIFVTLNPIREPDPATFVESIDYQHPLFDRAALRAQRRLSEIQGARRTWFCGAYFGHGFHEDGLQSGLAVAESITGARRPWIVEGESNRIAHTLKPIPATRIAAE